VLKYSIGKVKKVTKVFVELFHSEFTIGDLMGGKFNRKVAKLNANVIHLCASQGIPPNFIQPRRTIPNLLLLFDDALSELGR
jgi:beclin 1-associated autophagy-related key regulator